MYAAPRFWCVSQRRVVEAGVGTEGARAREERKDAMEVSRSCCWYLSRALAAAH